MENEEVKNEEVKNDSVPDEIKNKKIKNLVSIIILLGGLFVGSLFVDVAQLIRGGGFSQRMLSQVDVFESAGKTWVSFEDPIVSVKVVNDDECISCDPANVLVTLRRVMPTILTEKVDFNSAEGEKLAEDFNIKTLPAFVFSKNIEDTELYAQEQALFAENEGMYILKTAEAGIPVGKYLETPEITENDIVIGNRDAKVKIIEFSDFQCPFCKQFHEQVISKILEDRDENVAYVYKHLPLSFHAQAQNAALASECANEQEKFIEYSDELFAQQEKWGASTGTAEFKVIAAQVGLNASQFNECLDSKKYQGNVDAGIAEARKFGVSGTPGTFINGNFKNGVAPLQDLQEIIDTELAR